TPEERSAGNLHATIWCSEASCHSSGCKSRQQRSPVYVVVISSGSEGDQTAGSLEVKALWGRGDLVRSVKGGRATSEGGLPKPLRSRVNLQSPARFASSVNPRA